jgi:hypothetical protein
VRPSWLCVADARWRPPPRNDQRHVPEAFPVAGEGDVDGAGAEHAHTYTHQRAHIYAYDRILNPPALLSQALTPLARAVLEELAPDDKSIESLLQRIEATATASEAPVPLGSPLYDGAMLTAAAALHHESSASSRRSSKSQQWDAREEMMRGGPLTRALYRATAGLAANVIEGRGRGGTDATPPTPRDIAALFDSQVCAGMSGKQAPPLPSKYCAFSSVFAAYFKAV